MHLHALFPNLVVFWSSMRYPCSISEELKVYSFKFMIYGFKFMIYDCKFMIRKCFLRNYQNHTSHRGCHTLLIASHQHRSNCRNGNRQSYDP